MRDRFRMFVLMLALVGFGLAPLAGCNTTEGAGEDIEEAGEGIQDAAN